jgi:hypothetical protein
MHTFIPRTLSSSKRVWLPCITFPPAFLIGSPQTRRWLALLAAIALSFLSDTYGHSETFRPIALAYISLGTHAAATLALEHTQSTLSPALGSDLASAATTLGAACLAAPLYGFRRAMV